MSDLSAAQKPISGIKLPNVDFTLPRQDKAGKRLGCTVKSVPGSEIDYQSMYSEEIERISITFL